MNSLWQEKHPESPLEKPSDWYWFRAEKDSENSIIEVWPGRKYFPKGLWGPKIKGEEFS